MPLFCLKQKKDSLKNDHSEENQIAEVTFYWLITNQASKAVPDAQIYLKNTTVMGGGDLMALGEMKIKIKIKWKNETG